MRLVPIILLLILCATQSVSSQQKGIEILQVYVDVQVEEEEGIADFILKSRAVNEISSKTALVISFPNQYYDINVQIGKQVVPSRVTVQEGWTVIEITPITKIDQDQSFIIEITGKFNPEITKTETGTNVLRYDWGLNFPVDSFTIEVVLPYGALLAAQQENPNIFPSTAILDTNGTHMTISWLNLTYVEPNNIQTVIVEYLDNKNTSAEQSLFLPLLAGIIAGMIISLTIAMAIMKWKGINPRASTIEKPHTEIQIKTIYKPIVLKPQQVRILELIKENEPLPQSALIDFMGLSKSRVSQYLKELEEQNLIVREKDGKENLVFLKQDVEL
ncbi:MAG: MarR family transcriptional regulator [Methanobacteriota archaeon]|nr:MAG: MarR family transcriptional regulator [Euryarchaeota archaeon]